MQPNSVGNGGAQPVSPVRPVNPVSQAKPVEPVKAAVPAGGPTFDNGPSVVEGKGGKKTGWILGLVILAIIAAGGVGFGVWAWMDGNTQKDALNEQISSLKKQNNELLDQMGGDTIINIDTDTNADTADYIYVGEWGIKIKIPEGLNYVSYEFKQHGGTDQTDGSSVTVFGTVGDSLSDFANLYKNNSPLGAVSRVSKNAVEFIGTEFEGTCGPYMGLVFSDNDYNYCYEHPQSVYSTNKTEQDLETESVELIQSMLNNASNYSKI